MSDYPIMRPHTIEWYEEGVVLGATHMFEVLDGDEYGPAYVIPPETLSRIEQLCWISGHISGYYNLSIPLAEQSGNYEEHYKTLNRG